MCFVGIELYTVERDGLCQGDNVMWVWGYVVCGGVGMWSVGVWSAGVLGCLGWSVGVLRVYMDGYVHVWVCACLRKEGFEGEKVFLGEVVWVAVLVFGIFGEFTSAQDQYWLDHQYKAPRGHWWLIQVHHWP